jgi:MOSC domain-containing protein YiiM
LPRSLGRADAVDPFDKPWTSGIFKSPVTGPIQLGKLGLAGDGQADLENHGGEDKAVLSYSADHYPDWLPTLGPESATFGAFGENLTIAGLTEDDVCIGDVWQVGDTVQLQVSQPRQPCWKLARKWRIKDLVEQVQHNGRTGWYWRVIVTGAVEAGQQLRLLNRTRPEWNVSAANQVMHHHKHDRAAALVLADLPELAGSWRRHFASRAAKLASPSD